MGRLSLNCDLGENEPLAETEALLELVDAANICCGVHAGNLEKTRTALELAKDHGVLVGAHPGVGSAGGRGVELPDPRAFAELLRRQLYRFAEAAHAAGVPLNHIKLHGSLYSAVETDAQLAEVYLQEVSAFPKVEVFALSGGKFSARATEWGIPIRAELFADRGYLPDGRLVPRSEPGAIIESVSAAVARIRHWLESGEIQLASGGVLPLEGDTWCVHSDSPNAIGLLRALRDL